MEARSVLIAHQQDGAPVVGMVVDRPCELGTAWIGGERPPTLAAGAVIEAAPGLFVTSPAYPLDVLRVVYGYVKVVYERQRRNWMIGAEPVRERHNSQHADPLS